MMTPEERRELIDANVQAFGMAYVYDGEHVLDPARMVIHGEPSLTEYGQLMSDGGYHTRNPHPEIERIYPVADWIKHGSRFGGRVFRRRVIVVEDWTEVTEP